MSDLDGGPVPDFVAIDFETANRSPRSAVAVALVRVSGGEIAARRATFLRPPTRSYEFRKIHGIDAATVAEAPNFATAWPELSSLLRGVYFLAAHNAAFDMAVLRASCAHAGLVYPNRPWVCTLALARRIWALAPAGLAHTCRHLGIPLQHHDPRSDAEACATIVKSAWTTDAGQAWLRPFRR